MTTALTIVRESRPRLFRAVDDPDFRFPATRDAVRRRILRNILADCAVFETRRAWRRIPQRPDGPHPFHQLYITFYSAMQSTALIEQYSFAWRMTGDRRWLARAKEWLMAAARWEHGDRVEEHFYTANRYMHAFAVALDWLGGELTEREEDAVVACMVQLMDRWWPEVNARRREPEGGHHTCVDNAHFGIAALQLLGRHPAAAQWTEAVVDRFRAGIMPHGCGANGEAVDGPVLWAAENLWMLQFCDALRNVTGVDLCREFPRRPSAPLIWLRYHLAPPSALPADTYARPNSSLLTGSGFNQLDEASAVVLRLAQEAGDGGLRALALRDPLLGRIHRYGMGVKNCVAECMYATGPYAYMFYDPRFKPGGARRAAPSSRQFSANAGRSAILRSGWGTRSLVVALTGCNGSSSHSFANLHVQWAGHPVLRLIPAAEASPVNCGSVPCIGGQNELVALLGNLRRAKDCDTISAESPRLRQEYRLLQGKHPALLVTLRRKPRGIRLIAEDGESFVRTDGVDCLQYPRERAFNAEAGELRMRVRLTRELEAGRPQVLFHTGMSVPGTALGMAVNGFALGFLDGESLSFAVQSQRYLVVNVTIPAGTARMAPGRFFDAVARWGGLNSRARPADSPQGIPYSCARDSGITVSDAHTSGFADARLLIAALPLSSAPCPAEDSPASTSSSLMRAINTPGGRPFIELELDGHRARCDDAAVFGELGKDTQGLASRRTPRAFFTWPNTLLGFGGAVEFPGAGTHCDIARIELRCARRAPFVVDFADGLAGETGSAPIQWKLNAVELRRLGRHEAVFGAGPEAVRVVAVPEGSATFARETVPFFSAGLAASSLKHFMPGGEEPSDRVIVTAGGDSLSLRFEPLTK